MVGMKDPTVLRTPLANCHGQGAGGQGSRLCSTYHERNPIFGARPLENYLISLLDKEITP